MSRFDYRYKEISYDPSVLEAIFPAPIPGDNGDEEKRKDERARFVRSKMREVRKVMSRHLTARQNECLILYYLQGFRQREIADILGIHQTTASQHVRYALKKLQRLLGSDK
jgi:RNA polymerase sigma factor (sigma-70 family)